MMKISIKDYVKEEKENLKEFINKQWNKPTLVIIQVGDNEASNSYVKYKLKDCEEIGVKGILCKLSETIIQCQLEELVSTLNKDASVNGIIVQLPLPKHLNIELLQELISPEKDVDGFRPDSEHKPCTPQGVIDYLKANDVKLDGQMVTVIGRGKTAGEPMAKMLVDENATVAICHSHTFITDIELLCHESDIVISAVGKENTITKEMISPNTICIDIGRGDFASDVADEENDIWVSPKIGGTGLLTRLSLMKNVYNAFLSEYKSN